MPIQAKNSLLKKFVSLTILFFFIVSIITYFLVNTIFRQILFDQTSLVFKSDLTTANSFFQNQIKNQLMQYADEIARDDNIVTSIELEVLEEVARFSEEKRQIYHLKDIVVLDADRNVISKGYDHHEQWGLQLISKPFEIVQNKDNTYDLYTYKPIEQLTGLIGHVIVIQSFSNNEALFECLENTIEKQAIVSISETEIGRTSKIQDQTFNQEPLFQHLFFAFNKRYIGFQSKVPNFGQKFQCQITLLQDSTATLNYLNKIRVGILFFAVLFLCILTSMIFLLFRTQITRPISKMLKVIGSITKGDLDQKLDIQRSDELGVLAQSFDAMQSEIRRLIHELAEYNQTLEQKVIERTEALNSSNKKLQNEMEEKDDFLRAVSHDLNAPIRNIAGLVSSVIRKAEGTLDPSLIDRLERIRNNADLESDLLNELLELSRIKSRRTTFELCDLNQILVDIETQIGFEIEEKKIKLIFPKDLPSIAAEKMRIKQIFQNLIDNAAKYIGNTEEKEAYIKVHYHEREKQYEFWIEDNGTGIKEENIQSVFFVFRRVKNEDTAKIPGKGVGLASIKTIIQNYNGEIWVESEYGKGSTFKFTLDKELVHCDNINKEEIRNG